MDPPFQDKTKWLLTGPPTNSFLNTENIIPSAANSHFHDTPSLAPSKHKCQNPFLAPDMDYTLALCSQSLHAVTFNINGEENRLNASSSTP